MRTHRGPRIDATILGTASLLALAVGGTSVPIQHIRTMPVAPVAAEGGAAAFAGVWLSADDTVRLDLAPDLTYERSIVGRRATAVGTYTVDGTVLRLRDSSGLRTTVTSGNGQLEMAGYRLSRI